jgi:hypothetical protein
VKNQLTGSDFESIPLTFFFFFARISIGKRINAFALDGSHSLNKGICIPAPQTKHTSFYRLFVFSPNPMRSFPWLWPAMGPL